MPEKPDLSRYHRQMLLPGFGQEGQRRLLRSHAVVVGCGALGCTIADLLARAGVGRLTIIDRDVVEPTNLQRQTLFDERDAAEGLPKAEAARRRLAQINAGVAVAAVVADFNHTSAERIADGADVLLDGTDNFETRYLVNDLSAKLGVPYVYGGVVGTHGMQATFLPGRTPCLRCVFDEPPPPGSTPTCDTAGVFGPVVSIIGACEAADAIKVLLGRADLLSGTLLEMDLWQNVRRRIDLAGARREDCPCCGRGDYEFLAGRRSGAAASLCGRDMVQVLPPGAWSLDLPAISERLAPHGRMTLTRFLLRGRLEREPGRDGAPVELSLFPDGRALFRGVLGADHARSLYARYIGV